MYFLSKVPVFLRMFAITDNNYGSKRFHGVEGRFVYETRFWLISVTVFRYEGKVSQKNRSKFVKKIASLFRITYVFLCFPVSYMDISRNVLELQFSACHAYLYHASNAESPIFQNSSVRPNIRR